MAPQCTCGAQLPPDARFCHRCGKPQFELPVVTDDEPVVDRVERQPEAVPPAEIGFRNPVAVKTALLTALLGTLLSSLPLRPVWLWPFASLILAGFFAVFLYRRRTGVSLSIVAGARMGWLTGLFCFAFATVLFTLMVVAISSDPKLLQDQLRNMVQNSADLDRILQDLQTPSGLGSVLFTSLAMLFILLTTFPMLGGALGAKLLERDNS